MGTHHNGLYEHTNIISITELLFPGPACSNYPLYLVGQPVSAQDMPSSFRRQRVVWQEQIHKVKKAKEQLKLKSKITAQETLNLSAVMNERTDQD